MPGTLQFHIKTSRPGLWFPVLWLYIIPTAGMDIWQNTTFWVGMLYFTFPFNYLIYSLNDWADAGIDALNPRKNTYLFGAVGNHNKKRQILLVNTICQLPFWVFFAWHTGYFIIWWVFTLLFLNYVYNSSRVRLSGRPPWEMLVSCGYLLAFVISVRLNGNPAVPFFTYVYLMLFAIQSHLIGEVMDIGPDCAAGRRTTATVLGYRNAKLLLAGIITIESYLLLSQFDELLLGFGLAAYAAYMLADAFFIFKNKPYPLHLIKWFGICANIAALLSMVWLWKTGGLM